MTVKEAINILFTYEDGGHSVPAKLDALWVAIKALEKQMPHKVTVKDRGGWRCPVCRCYIYWPQGRYCPVCGQALDWSDKVRREEFEAFPRGKGRKRGEEFE